MRKVQIFGNFDMMTGSVILQRNERNGMGHAKVDSQFRGVFKTQLLVCCRTQEISGPVGIITNFLERIFGT